MSDTVGFIGLGILGEPMAANLAKAGKNLVVWNRSKAKCDSLIKAMATEAPGVSVTAVESPKAVVEQCKITYSMLSDLKASEAVYHSPEGILAGITGGKCIVDMATMTATHMANLDRLVAAKGGLFLEAPVSGSLGPAKTGTLVFLCGGSKEIYTQVSEWNLDAMGKAKFYFGPTGSASKMKLVVNMIMGSMMASLSEGMLLAESSGTDASQLLEVLDLGAMSNPMFRGKGPKMLAGDFAPNFPLKHAQKDMRFAIALGDEVGQPLPVAAAANETFKRGRDQDGDEDFSAVYKAARKL
ncbi:unnamed protein product [Chrysoparadoxa australica]